MRAVLLSAARGGLRCSARRLVVHAPAARHCSTKAPRSVTGTAGSNSTPSSSSSSGGSTATGGDSFWHNPTLRRNVSVLVGSQVMLNIGVSQVVPVLPILATEMGLGAAGIGTLMASSSFARLTCNLPLGRLADTWGRKPLMQYGTLVTAAGSVGTGLFMHSGLLPVLASRLLVGAGSASSMAGSTAMMQDLTDAAPQHRAQLMAVQSFVLSGIWVVGPLFGGALAEAYGVRNSFFVAGLGVALCSFGYARLPETLRSAAGTAVTNMSVRARGNVSGGPSSGSDNSDQLGHCGQPSLAASAAISDSDAGDVGGSALPPPPPPPPRDQGYLDAMRPLLASHNVQALSALATSTSFSQACFMAVLTLHARNLFDASPSDLGIMFSLVGISHVAGGPLGGWLAGRLGRKALIVPGLALSHVAFGTLVLAETREAFLALLLLSQFSAACTSPALAAFTAEVLPPESRGQAMSIGRTCADVASLCAPVALGVLADSTTCGTSILATAGVCSGCTAVFALRAQEVPLVGSTPPSGVQSSKTEH